MAINQPRALPPLPTSEVERVWSKIDRRSDSECWLWTGGGTLNGYGQFNSIEEKRKVFAHRIAYFLGYGVDPGPLHVLHICDVRLCCNPAHLRLGTAADNIHDAVAKGRMPSGDSHYIRKHPELLIFGERHANAKLKDVDVIEIRRLHATGEWLHRELAEKFGVERSVVTDIVNMKRWRQVR